MVKLEIYKCDMCNVFIRDLTTIQTPQVCRICKKDICDSCAESHAKDETELAWYNFEE